MKKTNKVNLGDTSSSFTPDPDTVVKVLENTLNKFICAFVAPESSSIAIGTTSLYPLAAYPSGAGGCDPGATVTCSYYVNLFPHGTTQHYPNSAIVYTCTFDTGGAVLNVFCDQKASAK